MLSGYSYKLHYPQFLPVVLHGCHLLAVVLGGNQFFRGRKDSNFVVVLVIFVLDGSGLFQLAAKDLTFGFRHGATGIAALLALNFSPPLADGGGQ